MSYQAGKEDKDLDIINLYMLEKQAAQNIPEGAFGYIQGGAGDEWTMRRNTDAFNDKVLIPRVLADLEKPDLRTSILGIDIPSPILMAPVAAHGLAHQDGEKATAKGVAVAGTIMGVSTYANCTIEDIANAGNGSPQWFQIYMRKDDAYNDQLVDRAKKSGAKAIILTADATVGGNRESDKIHNFTFPLEMPNLSSLGDGKGQGIGAIYGNAMQKISAKHVEKIASRSGLPVIVKGIQCAEDALFAMGAGAAAIYVSNHGGRQLDGGPGSFDVLEEVVKAVAGRVPVIFDSGIRRAQHVVKALACGADVVCVGRPVLYALSLGGAKGVASVFRYLNQELSMVMQLVGARNVQDARQALIRPAGPLYTAAR